MGLTQFHMHGQPRKILTVRVNQQISPDDEIIEFICNENQQFRRRVKID